MRSGNGSVDRHVRGILFADYVRMIRAYKRTEWTRHFDPLDLAILHTQIDPAAWYPMGAFERFGNAILAEIARGDVQAVRIWGQLSVDALRAANPALVVDGDPIETLMRFRVLRATYFDFEALEIPMLLDGEAQVVIHYYMGPTAEEAASFQTMGFFERLLDLAGATAVQAAFRERSWAGSARTVLDLAWRMR